MMSLCGLFMILMAVGVPGAVSIRPIPNQCMLHCDYDSGFVLSPRGCYCVPINGTRSSNCPELKRPCPTEDCRYGPRIVRDDKGCWTCGCRTQRRLQTRQTRCPPVCAIYCPNGNKLDANGCPTCSCNPGPWQTTRRSIWTK